MSTQEYYPRFPPTPVSQHPPPTKAFAEEADSKIGNTFGENGSIITYRHENGGLIGPFPILIASKEAGQAFGNVIQSLGHLEEIPADAKEVAILTVGAKFNCAFEQYAHLNIATKKAGLTVDQCKATREGRKPEGLSKMAEVTYEAAHYLVNRSGPLPKDLFDKWVATMGSTGKVLHLTHYVGLYSHVCVLMNMADTPLPPGEPSL